MLPEARVPRVARSPVLRCFRILRPCQGNQQSANHKSYYPFFRLTAKNPFFVFSDRLFRRCGNLSDRTVSTKPPRTSSLRELPFVVVGPVFSLLLKEAIDAWTSLRR